MSLSSRIVAVIVLVAVGAAFAGAQASSLSIPQPKHPPCHGHMPAPSRAPVSYQCCINGHHAAIPQATFSPRPLEALLSALPDNQGDLVCSIAMYSPVPVFVADSPPGLAPLRI